MQMPDDLKERIKLEREKIEVVSSENNDEGKDDDNENQLDQDNEKEKEGEEKEVKEGDEEEKSEKETEEVKDEKEDDEDDEVKEETDPEKLKRTIERLKKRIGKKTGSEKELRKELDALKAKLEALETEGKPTLTEEDVETRAEKIAAQKQAQKEFDAACNRLADEAIKIDKNFNSKVQELAEEVAPIPGHLIGMLDDIERGGAVLNYLCDNPEEYEELLGLSLVKQANRLYKISEKVKPTKPRKEISKVPEVKEPVKPSNNSDVVVLSDKDDMATWIEKRNKQIAQKRGMR